MSNFGQGDYGQVKFKISFQYDIGIGKGVQDTVNKLYFAYTQFAFWDLYEGSAPMRELDFTPMLMYQHKFYPKEDHHIGSWKFSIPYIKIGYLHQSDGRADSLNRSLFKVFVHSNLTLLNNAGNKNFKLKKINLFPQIWAWNMLASQNDNIADYQGYGQLITSFTFDWGKPIPDIYPMELTGVLIPAKKAFSYMFNLSLNFFKKWDKASWVPNFYAQYWNGFGESLINFDNRFLNYLRQKIFRMGIQFRVK
jgi:outer membrane phospholipase A